LRLPTEIAKPTEFFLYNLENMEEELKETREEIILAGYGYDTTKIRIKNSTPSDPVSKKVMSILKEEQRLKVTIDTVRGTLEELGPKYERLYQVFYKDNLNPEQAYKELGVARTTFFRQKKILIKALANNLGIGGGEHERD